MVESALNISEGMVNRANIDECDGFVTPVLHDPVDWKRLCEISASVLIVTQIPVGMSNVIEHDSLRAPVDQCNEELQRFNVIVERFTILIYFKVKHADFVERGRFPCAIGCASAQRDC